MSEDTNIKVAVRCRPFNTKEKNNNEASCVKILPDQIVLSNPGNSSEEHTFAFDVLYDENSKQEEVWAKVGVPILEKAFSGFNGTIFAYGQTGSGKNLIFIFARILILRSRQNMVNARRWRRRTSWYYT